ncbi:MAG: HAMP domain-containing histidine kinase [Bacteroidetes bacterium]|nr:HAMP domain-containing histidine kinase [Bacteroidota bacterium]
MNTSSFPNVYMIMSKKYVFILSLVMGFTMLGIIFAQLFWIKDDFGLRKEQGQMLIHQMIFPVILSLLFLLIMSTSFYLIIRVMFRMKKLSRVKTDFINDMIHEFKTPISTISLASEMLMDTDVNSFPYKTKRYASIIFEENDRLQKQVEQVLQLSLLDKDEFSLKLKEVDLHRIIRKMTDHFSIDAQRRGGHILTELEADHYQFMAYKTHLTNIVSNLIDNAIKYTPESPEIKIKTKNKNGRIILTITDNGIGISQENQKHIFKRLYRVQTENLHDVKGFGLGLFYVKTMVEAHMGKIELKSELNKGTTFIIDLPIDLKEKPNV